MSRLDIVFLLLIIAGAGYYFFGRPEPRLEWPVSDVQMSLATLQSLNGKSVAELATLRKDALNRDSELKSLRTKSYEFEQRPVWIQVGGGESWNGVEGMLFGTAANQVQTFSNGLSMDSYVLLNPYLPASIYPHFGSFGEHPDKEYEKSWVRSHFPKQANYKASERRITLIYQHRYKQGEDELKDGLQYNLNLINARDLGYEAFSIDKKASSGVDIGFDTIFPNSQSYLCDTIPGAKSKLNNLFYGPANSELLKVERFPARVEICFYRKIAGADMSRPDLRELIQIVR